jgi:hypothetical protein
MKAYLVVSNRYYEDSLIIERGFVHEPDAISHMDNMVIKINEEIRKNQIKWNNNPDEYRYYYKKDKDGNWNDRLGYYEIREIEIQL